MFHLNLFLGLLNSSFLHDCLISSFDGLLNHVFTVLLFFLLFESPSEFLQTWWLNTSTGQSHIFLHFFSKNKLFTRRLIPFGFFLQLRNKKCRSERFLLLSAKDHFLDFCVRIHKNIIEREL